MSITKELPHVGIDLKKIPISDEKEKLLMLEGMLESAEQSLLFYKNRVRELEKENERMRKTR